MKKTKKKNDDASHLFGTDDTKKKKKKKKKKTLKLTAESVGAGAGAAAATAIGAEKVLSGVARTVNLGGSVAEAAAAKAAKAATTRGGGPNVASTQWASGIDAALELNFSDSSEGLVSNMASISLQRQRSAGAVGSARKSMAARAAAAKAEATEGGKRVNRKALFEAFKEKTLPDLREENPGLKRSQLQERVFKLWKKAPENPDNWPED